MLAVPLTSILRIICSDLIQNGAGGYYILLLNQLLEGRPLDAVSSTDLDKTPTRTPARAGFFGGAEEMGGAKQA